MGSKKPDDDTSELDISDLDAKLAEAWFRTEKADEQFDYENDEDKRFSSQRLEEELDREKKWAQGFLKEQDLQNDKKGSSSE